MKTIIEQSLERSKSYPEYRNLVNQLVKDESATGDEKTADRIEVTKLNDRSMKRGDKTVKI